jgi:hypothetical protein
MSNFKEDFSKKNLLDRNLRFTGSFNSNIKRTIGVEIHWFLHDLIKRKEIKLNKLELNKEKIKYTVIYHDPYHTL